MTVHSRLSGPIAALLLLATATGSMFANVAVATDTANEWIQLFDGHSLNGWKASEHSATWQVEDGCLVARGARSHLFYQGPVGDHDFRNFELEVDAWTEPGCNSGVYFHAEYQGEGWPDKGYEVQINNTHLGGGNYRELKRTSSLYGVRNIYKSPVKDKRWFTLRVRVVGNRIRIWANGLVTVDYIQPNKPHRKREFAGRVLSQGTIALQGHDPGSRAKFRRVAIRVLPDDAKLDLRDRASVQGYGVKDDLIDHVSGAFIPVIDFHVHLRGGMTIEKAVARQAVTGINVGVLKNLGKGWPLETDAQLRRFLDSVQGRPVFAGLQVNDRDWYKKHSSNLLDRLDYVLGDTMIMPMPDDDGKPVKLWKADQYTIDDAAAWMERYLRHNLRVLSEPITILANPTYLPPAVADKYDELWTDQRMRKIIQAAIDNHVALEINARSGLPHDRFIRLAKKMGAKFSFGSNNFDDRPIDMGRYFKAIDRYGLTKDDMYVPSRKP